MPSILNVKMENSMDDKNIYVFLFWPLLAAKKNHS